MKSLHCPNPRCTHTFSPAQVQRTGVVKCPGCGQEFRFRPPGQTPPQPQPVVKPASPPIAMPVTPKATPKKTSQIAPPTPRPPKPAPIVAPKPAIVAPPPPPPAPKSTAKPEKLVRIRGPERSQHGLLKLVVLGSVLVILAGAGYLALKAVLARESHTAEIPQPAPPTGGSGALIFEARNQRGAGEKAFALNISRQEWSADKELAKRLKAVAVFKHADSPETWFAVAVQDFGVRNPREGELLNGTVDRLATLIGDGLQVNSSKLEKGKLGGLDATHCSFRGQSTDPMGECFMIARDGFAYWIFVVAKSLDGAQQQAKLLDDQKVFSFTTDRRDWTEQIPAPQMFSAAELAFSVKAPDNVWHANNAKSEDDNGVIYLAGNFQNLQGQPGDKSIAKNATLLGIALEKRPDIHEAFKDVLAHFEKKKQEDSKEYRFEPYEPGANLTGDVGPVGDLKGCVGEVRLSRNDDPKLKRYVVVAVFNDAAKTYGLRFECGWDHRLVWRKEFHDMIKTVRLGQK